ncbi:PREDICTED: exophilin-5 [Condylura cristata]|uniref:exophilin-5 n=1 Tax=Condylura cristata TaxID=143302 RepID=UPI00033437FD|nr:PREDICTED: exophilin-5 [Condylura cristata]
MTKVPQRFDFSFLNDEEARKILRVLERNEALQRSEKERISKLQKTKRDVRWLQGVTGEWFEEIQRKKFCNETDVSQMLKLPLTYRLRKGMAEKDQTSRSQHLPNQRTPTSVASRLSFRSSFASLFSFRKSRKEPHSLAPKGCVDQAGPPASVRGATRTKIHSSPLETPPGGGAFGPKPTDMREGGSMSRWDASLLENEFFQVLDDLDSKLAQEQFSSSVTSRTPLHHGSRTQFNHFYSIGNRHGHITGRHKNCYNETSNMSIYDILRPGTPREGFKTFSPRTRTIYDMYRTREPRVLKEYMQKNTFGSTSLCLDSRQRSALPATGHFSARSLHFSGAAQNKNGFIAPSHQQTPKRIPLSSIIWNRADSSRERQNKEEFPTAPSPMEVDPADQYSYPRCVQENTKYDFYRSQSVYQRGNLNAPMDHAMCSDPFENSENMPFYPQGNTFAVPFFNTTFGQNREQGFGQSPLWSNLHQFRKPFTSDEDAEMASIETNSTPTGHGYRGPSQHWGSLSHRYRRNVSRDQEEPHPWQFNSQTSTPENIEMSQDHGNQPHLHFGAPNAGSLAGSSYPIKSDGIECQHDSALTEDQINKEPYSFGKAPSLASSSKCFLPQISDDKRNSQGPSFQNPTVTWQKTSPDQPVSLPLKGCIKVTVTNSSPADCPSLTESQPRILVTEDQELDESSLEKEKQLNEVDQTNMANEILQPISQTVSPSPSTDSQSPLSQDSAKSNRFVFNASTTINSKGSPRGSSRRDNSKMYTPHKLEISKFKKDLSSTGNRKLGSANPFLLVRESRASSFPSTSQGCHQEITVNNEEIIQNNSDSTDNQNLEHPERHSILDSKEGQCIISPTTYSKSAPLALSKSLPDSSPVNNSFLSTLTIPPTLVLSRKSLSVPDPSLREREERDSDSRNLTSQFVPSSSENQKTNDSCVSVLNEVADIIKYQSHLSLRDGKGEGSVRQRISYIEKLSKTESRTTLTRDSSSQSKWNQSDPKVPSFHTTYCTLPRKSASFFINSRKSESEVMTSSLRNEPLPFQIRDNVEDPRQKYTPDKFSPRSSESKNQRSKVVSDRIPVAPEAPESMAEMETTGSASVRKRPLPFLIQRAASCPSGTCTSAGRGERECLGSSAYASAITPRPWERTTNPPESVSSGRGHSLPKRVQQKEYFEDKGGQIAASRKGVSPPSKEDSLPFASDLSGEESGEAVHKWRTTSMFSVSGDEDNVKCFEMVSIYYTLPRNQGKKIYNLLQKYSLTESSKVGMETYPDTLEEDKGNYSTPAQARTPSPEALAEPVSPAQNGHFPPATDSRAASGSPCIDSPEPTSLGLAPTGADASLHKGGSKTREISPHNVAKTLGDSHSRKARGKKMQSEMLHLSSVLWRKTETVEKTENHQQSIQLDNSGPHPPAHSREDMENSQMLRRTVGWAGSGKATNAGSGTWPQKAVTGTAIHDRASGLWCGEARGDPGADFQKMTAKTLCDSESQTLALTLALQKLHLDEAHSGEPDLESLQSEPRELPQRGHEVDMTGSRQAEEDLRRLAWGQHLLPGGSPKNKIDLDDLEKGKTRSSVKHRLAAMSKASRKFSAKDLNSRRHVATIFPPSGNHSGFGGFSLGTSQSGLLSPESSPKATESTRESRLSNDGKDAEDSASPGQGQISPRRDAASHLSNTKSDSISQPHQNEFENISESAPRYENSKDVTAAQNWETESETLTHQATFTSLRETGCADHRRTLPLSLPLEHAQNSARGPPASCPQLGISAGSPEWEPEPQAYRSKSLKNLHLHGDLRRQSQPPKSRERHFSENTSIDHALGRLTLGNELSVNSGYSRRFKSFSEFPSCEDKEAWPLYSGRTRADSRPTSSISRPIDYGIFGKEQQLAFLENVKRSLTEGRLWKPSFLKNPGFLKDSLVSPPNPEESGSSNSPDNPMPEEGLFPSTPLNIYEDDTVDSDCDTDTTTDDEYYLDEHDKESEL